MNDTGLALILAAILPGLVLVALLNSVDLNFGTRLRWSVGRPWSAVGIAMLAGAASAYPAYWLESAMQQTPWEIHNMGMLWLFAMVVAGCVEEGCKFVAFCAVPARTRWFTEEYDGILLAAAVSLGFASVENILYVREAGLSVAGWRAFTAVPAHAMFGVVMGAYVGMARARHRIRWSDMGLPMSGLGLAIGLHGLYDLLAFQAYNQIAYISTFVFLALLACYCVKLCWDARRHSPAFGGQFLVVPPCSLRIPPPPVPRNPWVAGTMGLIPGLGQAYNGEMAKSGVFLFIGLVNLSLYWIAHLFTTDVGAAIRFLNNLGITVVVDASQLAEAVEEKWLLAPILLGLVVLWSLVGALDAWSTARQRALPARVYGVRSSCASQGFGTSYVMHLLVIFLLVVAPVYNLATTGEKQIELKRTQGAFTNAGENDVGGLDRQGEVLHLTWVTQPVRIQGWQKTPEGRKDGTLNVAPGPPADVVVQPDAPVALTTHKMPGPPIDGTRRGKQGSYDQYLSYQVRRRHNDHYYFRHVQPWSWAIVRYNINHDGQLLSAELIKYEGPVEDAQRAVTVIQRSAPFEPLPGHAKQIEVTELFWSLSNRSFDVGSLEWKLSQRPDGRSIREIF